MMALVIAISLAQIAQRAGGFSPSVFVMNVDPRPEDRGAKPLGSLKIVEPPGSPAPPAWIGAVDHAGDDGMKIDVSIGLSPADQPGIDPTKALRYVVERASELGGKYEPAGRATADAKAFAEKRVVVTVEKLRRGEPYYFRARVVRPGETGAVAESTWTETREPTRATREFYDASRVWAAAIMMLICGTITTYIILARRGMRIRVRRIAGLDAVEEAVGRATEMGRSCLFVPGILDMNDIQTIAGLNILSRVGQVAAEYDAAVEVPTSKSLVMTAARETLETSFLAAGRSESYSDDLSYYVTDEQFGYVAFLTGKMVREKPAACFYFGAFYAESLMLAETGNSIGAIQVAGTAEPAQLPFFVAACDYTLIGEEFFAASAYLSGDPDQLGSLKGQDLGKLLVAVLLIVGSTLATLSLALPKGSAAATQFKSATAYLRETVLK